jgi:hypothetical protein
MGILQDPLHFLVIHSILAERTQGAFCDSEMFVKLPCFVGDFKVSCKTALELLETLHISYSTFQVISIAFRELLLRNRNCRCCEQITRSCIAYATVQVCCRVNYFHASSWAFMPI